MRLPLDFEAVPPIRFRVMAAGFATAALYHLAALTIPAFAKIAYAPAYPPLRHIIFILVDGAAAYLMLSRPPCFIWLYLVLTAQVVQGHGTRAWQTWPLHHRINWIDVITVVATLLGLAFLYFELPGKVEGTGGLKNGYRNP
jgi:hypothetical protein